MVITSLLSRLGVTILGLCVAVWVISSLQSDCSIISIPFAMDSDVCGAGNLQNPWDFGGEHTRVKSMSRHCH